MSRRTGASAGGKRGGGGTGGGFVRFQDGGSTGSPDWSPSKASSRAGGAGNAGGYAEHKGSKALGGTMTTGDNADPASTTVLPALLDTRSSPQWNAPKGLSAREAWAAQTSPRARARRAQREMQLKQQQQQQQQQDGDDSGPPMPMATAPAMMMPTFDSNGNSPMGASQIAPRSPVGPPRRAANRSKNTGPAVGGEPLTGGGKGGQDAGAGGNGTSAGTGDQSGDSSGLKFLRKTLNSAPASTAGLPSGAGEPRGSLGVANDGTGPGADERAEEGGAIVPHPQDKNVLDNMATLQLRTGEDAINFFARFGSNSPLKFVHLVQADTGLDFRPYDLQVVQAGEHGPEYYTMSAAGIVHVCPGQPSECTPLSEWMRHSTLFNIVRSIRFYKYFLHVKAFAAWQENVNFLLYRKQRKKLKNNLFFAKSSFCNPLMHLQRGMLRFRDVHLLQLEQRTCDIVVFSEQQAAQHVRAASNFEDAMREVTEEVQGVLTAVNTLSATKPDDDDPLGGTGGGAGGGGGDGFDEYEAMASEKHKSIVQLKEERENKKRTLARARVELGMLPDFIRLADHIVVETLVSMAVEATEDFFGELTRGRKTGIFETTVQFTDTQTMFSPACAEVQDMVDSVLESMVSTVGNVSRLLYLASSAAKGPNTQAIIRESAAFQVARHNISQRIATDFERAIEHAQSFDSVRPIYEFNQTWNLEAYKSQPHDAVSLKHMMERLANWAKELDKLRNKPIGILEVDSRKLKAVLGPMRDARCHEVEEFIKDKAREECNDLRVQYEEAVDKLSNRPTHLKDFAGQVAVVEELRAQERTLFKASAQVDQMYSLLQSYEVPIDSQDLVVHDTLSERQSEYRRSMEEARGYKDAKMGDMTTSLDMNIFKLNKQVETIASEIGEGQYIDAANFDAPEDVLNDLRNFGMKLDTIEQHAQTYARYQDLFNVSVYTFTDLEKCREQFTLVSKLWDTVAAWNAEYEKWLNGQFTEVNVEEVDRTVQVFFKEGFSLNKKLPNDVSEKLKDRTNEFKLMVPVVMDLGNPCMRPRHWEKIFDALGQQYYEDMPFTLNELLSYNVMKFQDTVQEVSGMASGEAQLEDSLQDVSNGWAAMQFTTLNHRDQPNLFILGALDEVFTLLEDNQVTLQTMMGSRYISYIQARVESWDKKLSLLSETLDEWVTCQRNWMYLENIFGAEDIQKQLPGESQKFLIVDRSWKTIMKRTTQNPDVLACLEPLDDDTDLLKAFQTNNVILDEIQRSLEDYLETKRVAFPRFYFLSNDELLEILSQTRDPHAVQPHMSKCFDAIKKLNFGEGRAQTDILGFCDPGGETIVFKEPTKAEGPVEVWLKAVEDAMRNTLLEQCRHSLEVYPAYDDAIDRAEWLWSYAAQVVICVDEIVWTTNLFKALSKREAGENVAAVQEFLQYSVRQIDAMVGLVQGDLTKLQRTLMGALLTIDVHAREVVRSMVEKEVSSVIDFEWTKQLRYYWDTDRETVLTRQTNAEFEYGYEYLGNSFRLVITPLTDLCYLTLTGALHMRLGGAPAGPAGTGKTETVKDLAKALAVYCVVFNCSDGLDYKIMGRFFAGLAQQGAWSCFDEFNRIDIEVLSVIAQQILCIQQAIVSDADTFEFEGKMISCNGGFGVFITMNPGYAGRTELPDNLKALFRPVAMMVPDYRLIAEIVLFSEGFTNAYPLSNKMTQLYSLSSEQLSKQDHYDFGMRAVKSVLVAAGQLKRKEPNTNEDLLLIRAMRDSNVPKFLEHDLPLFHGIVSDLFPSVEVPYVDYGALQEAIERALDDLHLQKVPSFITKVIQIHETQLVRHGMMVVGEAGSGKTRNMEVLSQALGTLYKDGVQDKDGFYKIVDRLILNPKSITAGQLYGEFNLLTNEWTDGLVPKLVRDCVHQVTEGSDNRKWIVFDGPVDAVWIENMNTVLDDNKTLCLANSERIKLPGTLHMMFEVQDLKVASPATVSRCGMVYMEQIHVGMASLVRTWGSTTLNTVLPGLEAKLVPLILDHLQAGIDFVREFCAEKVPSNNHNLTQSLLNLLKSMFKLPGIRDSASGTEEAAKADADGAVVAAAAASNAEDAGLWSKVLNAFVWSFIWSIGANVDDKSRPKFQQWANQRFHPLLGSAPGGNDFCRDAYGYVLSEDATGFRPWDELLEQFQFSSETPYFDLLVPTVDTTRYRYVVERLMTSQHHVLLMGETGVGKSVILQAYLNQATEAGICVSYTMGYSAQTKPSNLQDVFETKLDKKRKNLLGPPAGKMMFMFIDDLNMPALEVYGAQPPNELLRQVMDAGGLFDTKKLFFKNIQNVVMASACAPPGGGRNEVSPRLIRHFHMLWLTNLSSQSMRRIFSAILTGFLEQTAPSLTHVGLPIVGASVEIYERVERELLPTPTKSHYTFNLRDLSKVFQGVLMIESEHSNTEDKLLKLWCHEECRVFRDRLINDEDRAWFNTVVLDKLHSQLGRPEWTESDMAEILYGDFLSREKRVYQELDDRQQVIGLLDEYLEEYNMSFTSRMDLVFFADAVNHVARIARVLRQPRGNALLVGVGGSGRRSLTRLASFFADYKCRSIEITRTYGVVEWHDDLKNILMSAGASNEPTVFLFADTQIVMESFLEDLNNILNSGEVPNLYAPDEIEQIVNAVRPLTKAAGKPETRDIILQHYTQLVRENLHIVLCMSPIGAAFRTRCRMFPSLVNCCTIDWFNAWPEDALHSVAMRFLDGKEEMGIQKYVEPLCSMAVEIHRTVERETARYYNELRRHNYTTPTSYLELLRLYLDVLAKQRDEVSSNEQRYRIGLGKLSETEKMVADLQQQLTELQPVLDQAAKDTEELLVKVQADQKEADAQAVVVEQDVAEANKVAQSVQAIKDDCQADLDEAMPAYEASVKALDSLDKKSIQELKAFNNPPEMVGFTLEAVCILMGSKPTWDASKKLLGQMDFMQRLKDYDKDHIASKAIRQLRKYFDDPRFVPEEVEKVSSAAKCLCMWVRAMVVYDRVAKSIVPKKQALAKAEAELETVMASLKVKQDSLAAVLARVAELKATLQQTQDKKAELEQQKEQTVQRLGRAEQLIGGLGGEKIRWQASAKRLGEDLNNLVGNMVLAAGVLAYLGPFTSEFRKVIGAHWVNKCQEQGIPVASNFALETTLADPVVVRDWQIQGLPADEFSTENGLLTTMGRRWPLMVDPQGQANRWIRNTYSEANLQVIKLTEKDFLRTLENGVRYGAPVLLENVEEELDPALEPVLLKQIFKRGGQMLLRLGDSDVPYSDEFRFFITTKLANPHYLPEICIKVTVINFTVTMKGLEDQLLVDVIKSERPDLEEKRDQLIVSIASDQKELKDIEDRILHMLANATGNILDDEELIRALGQSKVTSTAINERLTEAEATTKEINDTREGYRVVATRGSVIYFVIGNMALADPMYQYSLQYYKALFNTRLQKSEKSDELAERLRILLSDITMSMYVNICRGLFEKDKLLFAFVISVEICRNTGDVGDAEWNLFMTGCTTVPDVLEKNPQSDAARSWLSPKQWEDAAMLEHNLSETFGGLTAELNQEQAIDAPPGANWRGALESDTPHEQPLPGGWDDKLSPFQKLLLIRLLREEMTVFSVRRFVGASLGQEFTEAPPFDLEGAFADSQALTPLIFILSPGADPMDYLLKLAADKGKGGGGFRIISLGQGQGPIAERVMTMARETGDWVCLQNCHLAVSWLPTLEQIIEQASNSPDDVHPDFRLWLTSMPSPKFPVPILQSGIKITNEPPRGLRANLLRTFMDLNEDEYSGVRAFKKLLFGLAFFNALSLERRKFGAVGWNIPYEWMNSDLKAGIQQVRMYVEDRNTAETIPWDTLNVLIAQITYGGRVTDRWDKRAIASIMRRYFTPEILDDNFRFSESGIYYAPGEGDLESVRAYVRALPMEDRPETFGLHSNADITFQQKETRTLLTSVITVAGRGGGGGGGDSGGQTTDELVSSKAEAVEKRMRPQYDMRKAHPESFKRIKGDQMDSLGVFLGQELVRFNAMMLVMKRSLKELQRAIRGEVVMSSSLEEMYNCFVFQTVPPEWEKAGYPCLKPLPSWIEDFFARIEFMELWLTEGPRLSYWLSGFFFPQGFMTAVKQRYSRAHLIAVDTLMIACDLTPMNTDDITEAPVDGVFIHGLYMEAGRIDREDLMLVDSIPNELFDPMPVLLLKSVVQTEYKPTSIYNCPVYKTATRAGTLSTTGHSTNFVVALDIPTQKSEDSWIRRGTAMLCMLST